ncbi:MAG: potassium-transporting ATPase subunit KdpC [Microlunatus sp.]|nr:potassium-transporting ATPase subunit KdpC [Brevibacterium aurantiacum]MDN5763927.1 potassium-transporting ATPase subunit KdpC [Microlunatus sp.]
MNLLVRGSGRTIWTAIRVMMILTLVLGVVYPLTITAIGQFVFPSQANGSIVSATDGRPVGSALIGQPFTGNAGNPLREYFQPRPSAAGDGYDAAASSGSNLGPENPDLIAAITQRRRQVAQFNDVPPDQVPVDALTASGSGLDPHISASYALLQAERVATARNLPAQQVRALIDAHTDRRLLGYIGEPRVNVLELNLALDELQP